MHEEIEELLARRSELSPGEEARLAEHLAGCPVCRATAEAYAQQTTLLRSLPVATPPPALRAGVLARARETGALPWWRQMVPTLPVMPLPILVPAGAAIAAIIVVVLLISHPHSSSPTALNKPTVTNRSATPATPIFGTTQTRPLPTPRSAPRSVTPPSAGGKQHVTLPLPTVSTGAPAQPIGSQVALQIPTATPVIPTAVASIAHATFPAASPFATSPTPKSVPGKPHPAPTPAPPSQAAHPLPPAPAPTLAPTPVPTGPIKVSPIRRPTATPVATPSPAISPTSTVAIAAVQAPTPTPTPTTPVPVFAPQATPTPTPSPTPPT